MENNMKMDKKIIKNILLRDYLIELGEMGFGAIFYIDDDEDSDGGVDVESNIIDYDFDIDKTEMFNVFDKEVLTPFKNKECKEITVLP